MSRGREDERKGSRHDRYGETRKDGDRGSYTRVTPKKRETGRTRTSSDSRLPPLRTSRIMVRAGYPRLPRGPRQTDETVR